MAFGAKRSVAPALEITHVAVVALKAALDQFPGPDEFSIQDDAQLAEYEETTSKFKSKMVALIEDGSHLEDLLHRVAHNMSAAYINWPEVNGWLADANSAIAAATNY